MKTLLAIEWLKVKKYRTFWVLAVLFVLLLPLWNYQINSGMVKLGNGEINVLNNSYSFPTVWGNMGFWGSIFVIFLSVLVIILVTNEYTFRTNRQNIIDGWTRLEFYHAKTGMVLLISLAATLYLGLLSIVFGVANSGSFQNVTGGSEKLFYFFVLCLNYMGFALLLSIMIKRSGLTIGLFMLYCLIVESAGRSILNYLLPAVKPGNYLPLQASDELLPFPIFSMAQELFKIKSPDSVPLLIASLFWICMYYIAGRWLLLRKDW